MTVEEVLAYYGSGRKACDAIKVNQQNFTRWRFTNYIPLRSQLKFEKVSNGELKANINDASKAYATRD